MGTMNEPIHAYNALRHVLTLTQAQRAPLVDAIAQSAEWSYNALRNIAGLTPEERSQLLEVITLTLSWSYETLHYVDTLTLEERTPILNSLQPTLPTPEQQALARRVMTIINKFPKSWNQTSWHAPCGTAHCFAGHAELLVYGDYNLNSNLTRVRARDALGLTTRMAEVLFSPRNTLEHLNTYVDYLTGETP